jgi:hypothetical protein
MDHMDGHEFSRVQTAVNDGVCVTCGSFTRYVPRVGLPKTVFLLKNSLNANQGGAGKVAYDGNFDVVLYLKCFSLSAK